MHSNQNFSDDPLVGSSNSPNSEDDTLSLFSSSPKSNINTSSPKYSDYISQDISKGLETSVLLDIFKTHKLNEEEFVNKKIRFSTKKLIKVQRGRKVEELENNEYISKRKHKSKDFDNLQTKIQVNFINFIVDISNDALLAEFGKNNKKYKYKFKAISYEIKRKVSFEICDKFKNSNIKDILSEEISSKYKKCEDKNINMKTLNEVCKKSKWLNEFFNMKYLKLFEIYYNGEKPLKSFIFHHKNIVLSNKTKSFHDLLLKNEDDKTELIETANSVYFYGYNRLIGRGSFIIELSENELNE